MDLLVARVTVRSYQAWSENAINIFPLTFEPCLEPYLGSTGNSEDSRCVRRGSVSDWREEMGKKNHFENRGGQVSETATAVYLLVV